MKTIILLFIVAATSVTVKAQTITSNSSAAECLQVIEAAARTAIGKEPNVKQVQLTGDVFAVTSDFGYTKYRDVYKHINWAEYKDISTGKEKNGMLNLYVNFKTESVGFETIETDKQTNLSKHTSNAVYNFFTFLLPATESARIAVLEAAAKRLQQLVQQNGNIFKTADGAPRIKNIEGKPSYEETVKFINDFLEGNKSEDLFCNTVTFTDKQAAVGENESGRIVLLSKYKWQGKYSQGTPVRNESFTINMANVEEIKVVYGEGFSGGCGK